MWLVNNQDLYGLSERMIWTPRVDSKLLVKEMSRHRLTRCGRDVESGSNVMGRYIARRLAQGLVVIFGVTVFVFVITRLVGDPVKFMLPLSAHRASERQREVPHWGSTSASRCSSSHFVGGLLRLDLGESTYVRGQSALVRGLRLPARAPSQLVALGMLLAVLVSIPLGVLASRKPGGPTDRILTTLEPRRVCRCRSSSSASCC